MTIQFWTGSKIRPLAASLGLTFTYHVTIGIPLYILIATALVEAIPVR